MTEPKNSTTYLNNLSVSELHIRFGNWFKLAKSGSSVDQLYPAVWELCAQIPFETFLMPSGGKLFRGRKASDDNFFNITSKLWYPPAEEVKSLGRANKINQPILYISQDARTSLFETIPDNGQHVAIAEINIREGKSLNLQHVGILNNLVSGNFPDISSTQDIRLRSQGYTDKGINNIKIIHRLLGEEFLRDVAPGNEGEYSVSAAIAQFYLSYCNADGLIYPSKRSPNDFNIAVKPSSADNKLFIKRVYGLQTTKGSTSDIEFQYWNASTKVTDDGIIEWHTGDELPPLDWNSAGHSSLKSVGRTSK